MISLKKYLDSASSQPEPSTPKTARTEFKIHPEGKTLFPAALFAYKSALVEVGDCCLHACPALGSDLKNELRMVDNTLTDSLTREVLAGAEAQVREKLQDWGRRTALYDQQKVGEVKELLLVMAKSAESVGDRDQRYAQQINNVTSSLNKIASLDNLSQIRMSIQKSAAELKDSIDRMASEGKAALDQLRKEVSTYQAKLEKAEQIASVDSLTGLRNRLCVEAHIERQVQAGSIFCVAILDINHFKSVNDEHGHLVGDELLQQFARELRSACRSTDIIGRWGGDEFIILMECGLEEAQAQCERLIKWVCGNYTLQEDTNPIKLVVAASIGMAEHLPDETLKELLARADALMYQNKASSRLPNDRRDR
jgi:diguanylate cyclase (GGDEF)-like protein